MGIPASALDLLTRNQILGGVVSSACFAAISGICILCVRRMRNADLKALIPSSGSNVIVVCPGAATRKGRAQVGLMTTEEAMALAEVLQCAGALNKMPSVQSCAEKTRHSGLISLGGINNSFTAANLSEFCRGLEIKSGQGSSGDTFISHGSTQVAPPTERRSIAFIIFLSSAMTGCRDPVLLIFGEYGIDTCAAAHYLRTNARRLRREFRGHAFAVKLMTHPILGHQGFPGDHENITDDVFGKAELSRDGRLSKWINILQINMHNSASRL